MLDQCQIAPCPDHKRAQLFTERYQNLLAWALRLTHKHRESAEDLVHDAFVQFMSGRTTLEEIENIDGYLRRMLLYMHLSRTSRSPQQLHETSLSVADVESYAVAETSIEPPTYTQTAEKLHQVCIYACWRKESSRAGSVLILRFFHEYCPEEIADLMSVSRHCVYQWQTIARREVKQFMAEPGHPKSWRTENGSPQPGKYLQSNYDVMTGIRRMIFDSARGECVSQQVFNEIYLRDNRDELTTTRLAHIVSCAGCLDLVNSLLGLPLLAQRYRTDVLRRA
jgi:RNA polymerase sigma factor (sigma-70 family)